LILTLPRLQNPHPTLMRTRTRLAFEPTSMSKSDRLRASAACRPRTRERTQVTSLRACRPRTREGTQVTSLRACRPRAKASTQVTSLNSREQPRPSAQTLSSQAEQLRSAKTQQASTTAGLCDIPKDLWHTVGARLGQSFSPTR
jgi:hypothetical protein